MKGGPGSVWFGCGWEVERFERFLFSVLARFGSGNRREESSMDQCQSREKLSTNFQGHWSIVQILTENKAPRDWSI